MPETPALRPFRRESTRPPLAYCAGQFDFIYSLSVFTHMPETMQYAWVNELRRVLKPGGYLLVTTHGERYLESLNAEQLVRFHAGEMVVQQPEKAGTNLCASFHPPQ